ncbi:carbohydrate ABC transporter permease [Bacillus sp. FJAT-50079]|uniref:carbohydrate ABC transporter permease n=1 Tax=Bacillus sp. FJAT-50079 TaxID=2833577 RepID=UPI001BC8F375|nr:carbohydrate ABC transporter permease [Bacillus sp. FJAT-50079]MBS4206600.1 carbohydrate ABC transporter permease [Bacillus sp. FJAT-50079]
MKNSTWKSKLAIYIQLAICFVIFIFPILWMLLSAFKQNVDITSYPPKFLFTPTLDHFRGLFSAYPFGQYILNSIIITAGSTLLGLILGVPAAYAAARYNLQWTAFLSLIARMAPGILFLIPWYVIASQLGLTDNYLTLIVTHTVITMPLIVWLMLSYFQGISKEIEESAMIDGCGPFRVLWQITLPLALPGLSVATALAFIFSWNYFLFSLVLSGSKTTPLTVAAFNFIGVAAVDWGGLMAAATLITVPVLIIVSFVQRWLVSGLTSGAVK